MSKSIYDKTIVQNAMDIIFEEEEVLFRQMQDAFNEIEDALYKSHYDLAKETSYSATSWKNFLTHPKVADWLAEEMRLVAQTKLRLLLKDIDSDTKSTGLAQLINTIGNQVDGQDDKKDSGPIFVYAFIPLTTQEEHAPNVRIEKHLKLEDIIKK